MALTDSPGGTGLRFLAQEGPMRFRTLLILTFTAFCLTACGKAVAPTVAPVRARMTDAHTASPSPGAATPTPLATPVPVVPARTPVASTAERPVVAQATPPTAVRTVAPTATSSAQQPARMTDIPTGAPRQTIGTAQDGLVLLNVRVGKDTGFTRIVFDLAKQDGSAAPVPQTRLWREGDTLIVAFGGVRADVFGQSLGGGERAVNTGAVQSLYRIPVRDDAAAAYGIAIRGGAKVTLSALTSPTRVIVDIADG